MYRAVVGIIVRNFDSGFHGPVSMSEALVRSLNLPAVQVLEAYGPKRFAALLRNSGLLLYLPAGATPNLSLILGAQARGLRIWSRRTALLLATAKRENCVCSRAIPLSNAD